MSHEPWAMSSRLKANRSGLPFKHRAGFNSVKLYDKQGSVLRAETTINDPRDFKVFRPVEGKGNGRCAWRAMRKGIAQQQR